MHNHDITNVEASTLSWVNRVVVGLNLCPFANAVVKSNDLLIKTEISDDITLVLTTLVDQCDAVQRVSAQATMLLLLPNGFDDFNDYLDLVDLAEALLDDLDLQGVLQLATFHPYYQFNDTDVDDAANYSNRSPYPMLHILQEAAVEQAVEKHPDTDGIPQRNIDLLQAMSHDELNLLVNHEMNLNDH